LWQQVLAGTDITVFGLLISENTSGRVIAADCSFRPGFVPSSDDVLVQATAESK
jgi:hypothetical protein